MTEPAFAEAPPPLHVDDDLLVFEKPAGLRSVPGRGADKADALSTRAAARWGPLGVVHRLDEATSGLIVFARNPAALRTLSTAFAERAVDKEYEALLVGPLPWPAGRIVAPLRRFAVDPPTYGIDWMLGKVAETDFEVLAEPIGTAPPERGVGRTRVRFRPRTGRSHQLRCHAASLGCPILGDPIYAPAFPASRLHLHATCLRLTHPTTGAPCVWRSPCPF